MVLDWLRRNRPHPQTPGQLSCYGKLPFYPEFLRFHLESDVGRWLVEWIDSARRTLPGSEAWPGRESDLEIRLVLAHDTGRQVVAALLRPSTDAGTRAYPICVFTSYQAHDLRDRWYLMPLWLEPLWRTIDQDVLEASVPDPAAFAAKLDAAVWASGDIGPCAQRFDELTGAAVPSPWQGLTGAEPERARQLAETFVRLADVQATARGPGDGVAVRLPEAPADVPGWPAHAALRTAVWLRLFTVASGLRAPCAATIEVWHRHTSSAGSGPRVYLFGREPIPADLTWLLTGAGEPPIDDLDQPWEGGTLSERARSTLAALQAGTAKCVADLWRSIG